MTELRDLRLDDFPHQRDFPLRWLDVDRYGHVNNVVHYALMDTIVNDWVGSATGVAAHELPAVGLVVETGCTYFREIGVGDTLTVALRAEHLGTSSIRYQVGFFVDDAEPAAVGRFIHVYVDPATRESTALPDILREAAAGISG